ncbi:hypothetical protein FB45DRAFT_864295 [Roridomyces roridus]|uniref:F-box domain-containing protein n=1 Tax=Roridomyces roridus TaxID=1738132 RepID=A0AAD7C0H4_9AGAR|nr:hypothetical protein FB45DRAFT_864295 [Roridomyces roridus]
MTRCRECCTDDGAGVLFTWLLGTSLRGGSNGRVRIHCLEFPHPLNVPFSASTPFATSGSFQVVSSLPGTTTTPRQRPPQLVMDTGASTRGGWRVRVRVSDSNPPAHPWHTPTPVRAESESCASNRQKSRHTGDQPPVPSRRVPVPATTGTGQARVRVRHARYIEVGVHNSHGSTRLPTDRGSSSSSATSSSTSHSPSVAESPLGPTLSPDSTSPIATPSPSSSSAFSSSQTTPSPHNRISTRIRTSISELEGNSQMDLIVVGSAMVDSGDRLTPQRGFQHGASRSEALPMSELLSDSSSAYPDLFGSFGPLVAQVYRSALNVERIDQLVSNRLRENIALTIPLQAHEGNECRPQNSARDSTDSIENLPLLLLRWLRSPHSRVKSDFTVPLERNSPNIPNHHCSDHGVESKLAALPRTRASSTQRRPPSLLPTYMRAILWATNDHQKLNNVLASVLTVKPQIEDTRHPSTSGNGDVDNAVFSRRGSLTPGVSISPANLTVGQRTLPPAVILLPHAVLSHNPGDTQVENKRNSPRVGVNRYSEKLSFSVAFGDRGGPISLTWVCRAWRNIAHSSELWTSFNSYRHPVKYLPFWLHHAGSRPLDLEISLPSAESEAQALLSDLCESAQQWRTARFSSFSPISLASVLRGPFPALEKLCLCGDTSSTSSTLFRKAPRLREVNIFITDEQSWRKQLPWAQLTTLILFCESPEKAVKIARCIPQVEDLSIVLVEPEQGLLSPPTAPFVLSHLRTLSLGDASGCGILHHLTLPALENFRTNFKSDDDTQDPRDHLDEMSQLLDRSQCRLRKLDLKMQLSVDNVNILIQFMTMLPMASLRELTIQQMIYYHNYVQRGDIEGLLTNLTSRDKPLLPSLESLRLERCDFRVPLPPLVRMLSARRSGTGGVAILKSFYTSFAHADFEEDLNRDARKGILEDPELKNTLLELKDALLELRRLREDGLCVKIESDAEWFTEHVRTEWTWTKYGNEVGLWDRGNNWKSNQDDALRKKFEDGADLGCAENGGR